MEAPASDFDIGNFTFKLYVDLRTKLSLFEWYYLFTTKAKEAGVKCRSRIVLQLSFGRNDV